MYTRLAREQDPLTLGVVSIGRCSTVQPKCRLCPTTRLYCPFQPMLPSLSRWTQYIAYRHPTHGCRHTLVTIQVQTTDSNQPLEPMPITPWGACLYTGSSCSPSNWPCASCKGKHLRFVQAACYFTLFPIMSFWYSSLYILHFTFYILHATENILLLQLSTCIPTVTPSILLIFRLLKITDFQTWILLNTTGKKINMK